MTEPEAVAAANAAARAAGANLEEFRAPKVRWDQGEWIVLYQGKKMLVGDHFIAVVDDRTGLVSLTAGA